MVTLSVAQYELPSRPARNRYSVPSETGYDERRLLEQCSSWVSDSYFIACIHVEEVTSQETLICSYSR